MESRGNEEDSMSEIVFIQLRDGAWLARRDADWFDLPFEPGTAQEMLERTRTTYPRALVVLIGPRVTAASEVA